MLCQLVSKQVGLFDVSINNFLFFDVGEEAI